GPSLPDGTVATFTGPFLGLASQAAWDGSARTLDPGTITGEPTVVRVLMGGADRSWSVFAPAGSPLTVPQPPPGWGDAAPGSRMTIQAVRAPAGLSALAAGGATSLADLLGAAEAFSSLDLPR